MEWEGLRIPHRVEQTPYRSLAPLVQRWPYPDRGDGRRPEGQRDVRDDKPLFRAEMDMAGINIPDDQAPLALMLEGWGFDMGAPVHERLRLCLVDARDIGEFAPEA